MQLLPVGYARQAVLRPPADFKGDTMIAVRRVAGRAKDPVAVARAIDRYGK